ncbi:hypothetical protein AMJ49_06420 [Parcubacteria bacterium DG_74_2]|nr:MAG: hypothetical protein AMJ49_06420 [Parcubacteria bacterium DG_74_2]
MFIYPELKIFLIAMTPFGELRAAIPIALEIYKLPIWSAYLWSVLGNLVPVILILKGLKFTSEYLSHNVYFFNRFFAWLFERTRNNHAQKVEKWKEIALLLLVAIPLPFTGAWTGSLVAFVFGFAFKKAFPLIVIGVMSAGVIVTFGTLLISKLTF